MTSSRDTLRLRIADNAPSRVTPEYLLTPALWIPPLWFFGTRDGCGGRNKRLEKITREGNKTMKTTEVDEPQEDNADAI